MGNPDPALEGRGNKRSGIVTLGLILAAAVLVAGGLLGTAKIISLLDGQIPTADLDLLPSPSLPGEVENSPVPAEDVSQPPVERGSVSRTFEYEYQCQSYSTPITLYESTYEYYSTMDTAYYYQGEKPLDWQGLYYRNFLESEDDLAGIRTLIDSAAASSQARGDELVIVLTSLVQNLTYDCDKLFSIDNLEGQGFKTKFPYETLYTQKGVCEDSSILLAKILQSLGYGAAFLIYEESNHMAVGLQCPVGAATYVGNGVGYCYVETTAPSRIGVKPPNVGGAAFGEEPKIYPIQQGKTFNRMSSLADEMNLEVTTYGARILQLAGCEEIAFYKEIRDRENGLYAALLEIGNLESDIEGADQLYQAELAEYNALGCEGSLPQEQYDRCLAQGELVNQAVEAYNSVYQVYKGTFDQYRSDYDQYQTVFNAYQALVQNAYQGCAVVNPGSISIQEAHDSQEP